MKFILTLEIPEDKIAESLAAENMTREEFRDGIKAGFFGDMTDAPPGFKCSIQVLDDDIPLEKPCCHEWYQGACVHCEITVKEYRQRTK